MANWYHGTTCAGQGAVTEEGTGRSVALTYDAADAPLAAASPAMLALLHIMVNETEANGQPSARTMREARQVLCDLPEPDFSIFAEPEQYGIQHSKDGRWLVGWTADRARRMIWSFNRREAYRTDRAEAARQVELLRKYRKPVAGPYLID